MFTNTYHCLLRQIGPLLSTYNARNLSIKVAVVGSGPAGFYTTQKLLKNPDVKVDIYERLPVPFGLVRYGVAPDHADVKNVINSFTSVASNDRVNFYGNVSLGQSVALDSLIEAYHAVVLCYGSAQDKLMGIEGEDIIKNTISARNFVGWYNGVPEDKDLKINLDCETACIIGQGNVALDCARILLKPTNLEKTDITTYAQQFISKSRIKRIYIIGRRGPVQVSFTTKELRELINLNRGKTRLEPSDIFEAADMTTKDLQNMNRQRRRLTQLLRDLSPVSTPTAENTKEGVDCVFKFFSKPHRIIADPTTGSVSRLELRKTKYLDHDSFMDEKAKPADLDDELEVIDCGLIIRSIGYKAVMVDKNIPMNPKIGAILNTDGRIQGYRNLYCAGWLATGASGVIAGTLNSSHLTAQSIIDDIRDSKLPNIGRVKLGFKSISNILKKQSIQVVHFNEWLRIDEFEKRLGESLGKTREKLVNVEQMLDVARKADDDRT